MYSERDLFLNYLAQTSDLPLMLEVASAKGSFIYDVSGKQYLDLIAGISVSHIGHSHPKVKQALKDQIDKYLHVMVYGEFVQNPQTAFAEQLINLLPENLDNIYFVNSGSEAAEGGMKLAKRRTGREKIVSFNNGYHGSTHGALSVAGDEKLRNSFRPLLPGISRIPFNDISFLDVIDEKTACVIIEPVQGEAGAVVPDINFMKSLREKCNKEGALLIFDEIQAAFGRTGSMFAFEDFEVIPDILLLGKAMGGGLPIGAFISSKEIMGTLKTNPVLGHISTFGGHPLPCTSGKAALEVLTEEKLIDTVPEKEKLFRKELQHPLIKGIKGKGLLLAVEFGDFELVQEVIKRVFEKGIITDWFVFNDKCMRIAPPLSISKKEIKFACGAIIDVLEDIFEN